MKVLSIGEKIRKKRKELGMTLKDLAGSRVTTGQLSLVESGKSNPSMELLEYISKNLKTSMEYLLESEQTQAVKICTYYENMAFCNLLNKDSNGVDQFLLEMSDIVNKYNLEQIKYKIYFIRGIHMYRLGDLEGATENILMANNGFLKFSLNDYIIQSFLYLAYISIDCKNYISAVVHLSCIIKIIDENILDYNYVSFKVYYLAFRSYVMIGNNDLGNFYLGKAVEMLDKTYSPRDNGSVFMERSYEFMKLDDLDNAIKFSIISRKHFEEFEELKDRKDIEIGLSNYLIEKGNLDDVEGHLKRVNSIIESYKFSDKIEMYISFTKFYLKRGDIVRARDYLDKFEYVVNGKNIHDITEFYNLKYEILLFEKNYECAENTMLLLCDLCTEFGEYVRAGSFYLKLYKLYVGIERFKDARDIIQKAKIQYEKGGYKFAF